MASPALFPTHGFRFGGTARSGALPDRATPGNCLPDCVIVPAVTASEHKHAAPSAAAIRIAILTVSDTRTDETDVGGRLIRDLCATAGHTIVSRAIVRDEPAEVAAAVQAIVDGSDAPDAAQVVLLTGGTGIARRDTTVEALAGRFDKTLDGFGELFRMLSFAEIGAGRDALARHRRHHRPGGRSS